MRSTIRPLLLVQIDAPMDIPLEPRGWISETLGGKAVLWLQIGFPGIYSRSLNRLFFWCWSRLGRITSPFGSDSFQRIFQHVHADLETLRFQPEQNPLVPPSRDLGRLDFIEQIPKPPSFRPSRRRLAELRKFIAFLFCVSH